ncbi:MAG: hypothetical protein FJ026_05060 [Chloroflexi bacterium]|nr:hypothetical protein [Chloroflexota bacterium]
MSEEEKKTESVGSKGHDDWEDIGRRIESQIRREFAKAAGASETDSWDTIARKADARIRSRIASEVGAPPDATWEDISRTTERKVRAEVAEEVGVRQEAEWSEIGRRIESQVKAGLGSWAGASAEDDWSTVGNKMASKIQKILDEAFKLDKREDAEQGVTPPSESKGGGLTPPGPRAKPADAVPDGMRLRGTAPFVASSDPAAAIAQLRRCIVTLR